MVYGKIIEGRLFLWCLYQSLYCIYDDRNIRIYLIVQNKKFMILPKVDQCQQGYQDEILTPIGDQTNHSIIDNPKAQYSQCLVFFRWRKTEHRLDTFLQWDTCLSTQFIKRFGRISKYFCNITISTRIHTQRNKCAWNTRYSINHTQNGYALTSS